MKLKTVKKYIKRINQVIIVFPVWITLGISYLFIRNKEVSGWVASDIKRRYNKMY